MDKTTQATFKVLLEEKRRELLEQAKRALGGDLIMAKEELPDEMDLATSEYDRFLTIRFRGRERTLLNKIEKSLSQIAAGTYGTCNACGEEIPEGRLKLRPVAELCIRCKEEEEQKEKRYKD
jgi:RNA polymerase-binding transcription factor